MDRRTVCVFVGAYRSGVVRGLAGDLRRSFAHRTLCGAAYPTATNRHYIPWNIVICHAADINEHCRKPSRHSPVRDKALFRSSRRLWKHFSRVKRTIRFYDISAVGPSCCAAQRPGAFTTLARKAMLPLSMRTTSTHCCARSSSSARSVSPDFSPRGEPRLKVSIMNIRAATPQINRFGTDAERGQSSEWEAVIVEKLRLLWSKV